MTPEEAYFALRQKVAMEERQTLRFFTKVVNINRWAQSFALRLLTPYAREVASPECIDKWVEDEIAVQLDRAQQSKQANIFHKRELEPYLNAAIHLMGQHRGVFADFLIYLRSCGKLFSYESSLVDQHLKACEPCSENSWSFRGLGTVHYAATGQRISRFPVKAQDKARFLDTLAGYVIKVWESEKLAAQYVGMYILNSTKGAHTEMQARLPGLYREDKHWLMRTIAEEFDKHVSACPPCQAQK